MAESNYENDEYQFNLIISSTFSLLDIIITIIFLYFFGIEITNILKVNLLIIIILDIILRIINIVFLTIINLFLLKEIIISMLSAYQFVFLIVFLNNFFSDKQINIEAKYLKIENKFLAFFIVFGFIFVYDTHYSYYIKALYGTTYMVNIIFLFLLYKYIFDINNNFLLPLHGEKTEEKINDNRRLIKTINGLSYISLIFYIIYYFLNIIKLFSENTFFIFIINIICAFPKELGKYFIFVSLGVIYYFFINNIYENIKNNNQTEKDIENNIKTYKNEEEVDNDNQILK